MTNRWGKSGRFYFLGFQNHCSQWLQSQNWKAFAPWEKNYDKPRWKRHYFADKGPCSQRYGFASGHIWIWELDHEGWTPNWCFQIVVQKTLESPLDIKEIKLVSPKGNEPWIFIAMTDAESEAPVFRPLAAKSQLIGKDSEAGKYWGQEEKGTTEDEIVGWYHDKVDMSLSKLREIVKDRRAWCAAVHGVAKNSVKSNWTATTGTLR